MKAGFVRGLNWALGGMLVLASCAAFAQEVTLKVHHFLPPGSTAHAKFIGPWCEKLARDSGGKLKCQIYPAMQLGGTPPQLIDQVRDGVADVVWTLPGYSPGRFSRIEVFELPFMITTAEATSRAIWEIYQDHAQAEFKEVRPLGFHAVGAGHLYMVRQPIRSMSDLRGLKVRAPTRLTTKMLTALGATPVGMPVPQVADALSKGVIDGALLPYEVVPAVKAHELTKFASEVDAKKHGGLYTSVAVLAMNRARYDALPPELRKVIDANSGAGLSAWIGQVWDEAEMPAKKLLVDRGNTVNVVADAEVANWKKIAQPVVDDWIKDVAAKGADGKVLYDAARAAIAKNTK